MCAHTRLLAIVAGLLAMLLQSVVVQAHIHSRHLAAAQAGLELPADATVAKLLPGKPETPRKQPPLDSDANCSLCQQFHGGGQFLSPSAAAQSAPALVNIRFITYAPLSVARQQASHSWRGRAPPLA